MKEAREGASGVPSDNNEGPAVDAQVERFRRQAPAARGGAHANRRSWLLLQIAVVFFLFCYFLPLSTEEARCALSASLCAPPCLVQYIRRTSLTAAGMPHSSQRGRDIAGSEQWSMARTSAVARTAQ